MSKLRIQRTPILPRQLGSLRRHRWYQALGDARPTRIARSHAAAYRAMKRARALGLPGFWYGDKARNAQLAERFNLG